MRYKKLISVLLVLCCITVLCGCGNKIKYDGRSIEKVVSYSLPDGYEEANYLCLNEDPELKYEFEFSNKDYSTSPSVLRIRVKAFQGKAVQTDPVKGADLQYFIDECKESSDVKSEKKITVSGMDVTVIDTIEQLENENDEIIEHEFMYAFIEKGFYIFQVDMDIDEYPELTDKQKEEFVQFVESIEFK